MGYYSDFEVTTYPIVANAVIKNCLYQLDNNGCYCGNHKWYDYQEHLAIFSKDNENIIITCFRAGENLGDVELIRWINGEIIEEKKFDKKEFCKLSDELKKRVDIFDCGSKENLEIKPPVVLVSCRM